VAVAPAASLRPMQISTYPQADNHASTPPLSFYRPGALPATKQQHQSTEVSTANQQSVNTGNNTHEIHQISYPAI